MDSTIEQGLAAAVQLNLYLEENAIKQLDRSAGKDQGKFQVCITRMLLSCCPNPGELQEAGGLSEDAGGTVCQAAAQRRQGGGRQVSLHF